MKTLKRGSKGEEVKKVQRILQLVDDGIYGVLTEEAVREFQAEHGLGIDGIVGPLTWEALEKSQPRPYVFHESQNLKKSSRRINEIIVHCTASPEGKNQTVAQIRNYHVKHCGWSDIAYHYVVYLDGTVHEGRDVNKAGAHTRGHNTNSIGVVYVGGLAKDGKTAKDTRTPEQKAALVELLKRLKALYPLASIHGHREYANKACPCFDAKNEYKNL